MSKNTEKYIIIRINTILAIMQITKRNFAQKKIVKVLFTVLLLCGYICFHSGCKSPKKPNTALTFTDDVQQVHVFKENPKRVVCLVPSITEILYAIGTEDKLVAVTEHCDYPDEAQKHPKKLVVYPNVSTEQVLALKPDIILTSTEVMSVKIIEQFKPHNIPVFFVNYQTLKDIPRSMRLLGKLLNTEKKSQLLADSTEKIIVEYSNQKIIKRPKTWLVIGTQPLYTAGKNSFMNDVIHLAGGENIASGISNTTYPVLTREFILSQHPEYIIISKTQKNKVKQTLLSLYPEMKVLPCLQDTSKIIEIEENILVRPTVRSLKAVEHIKKAFILTQSRKN
jgi:iron complex transport system substrate-binding protein